MYNYKPKIRKMRKIMMSALALMILASAASALASGDPEVHKSMLQQTSADTAATQNKPVIDLDSVSVKGARLGRKVADGTLETIDSIGAAGKRLGKKSKVWGDSISARSKRAWKAWNAGRDDKAKEEVATPETNK